jgi:hypothetical protein
LPQFAEICRHSGIERYSAARPRHREQDNGPQHRLERDRTWVRGPPARMRLKRFEQRYLT